MKHNFEKFKPDVETGHEELLQTYEYPPEVRRGFIRKVYGILGIQLLLTSLICATALTYTPIATFVLDNNVFAVSLVSSFAIICCFSCVAQKHPWNLLFLLLFTVCESFIIARLAVIYQIHGDQNLVLMSASITCLIFLVLTFIACVSKKDFSFLENILCIGLISFLGFTILQIFVESILLHMFIAWGGVLLFSGYILYDTSQILNRLGPDDAIHASLMLYLDVLNIFVLLLQILRGGGGD
jgi:hypothetical protein